METLPQRIRDHLTILDTIRTYCTSTDVSDDEDDRRRQGHELRNEDRQNTVDSFFINLCRTADRYDLNGKEPLFDVIKNEREDPAYLEPLLEGWWRRKGE